MSECTELQCPFRKTGSDQKTPEQEENPCYEEH